MENCPFIDDLSIKMIIFYSYVSLPKGSHYVNMDMNGYNGLQCDISPTFLSQDTWACP